MIDRLRRRRDVEASLPPITDDASLQKRLELLTKLEVTEWGEREAQIQQFCVSVAPPPPPRCPC